MRFLIDHFPMWHHTGDLVLYKPEDKPITALGYMHPSEIAIDSAIFGGTQKPVCTLLEDSGSGSVRDGL